MLKENCCENILGTIARSNIYLGKINYYDLNIVRHRVEGYKDVPADPLKV